MQGRYFSTCFRVVASHVADQLHAVYLSGTERGPSGAIATIGITGIIGKVCPVDQEIWPIGCVTEKNTVWNQASSEVNASGNECHQETIGARNTSVTLG